MTEKSFREFFDRLPTWSEKRIDWNIVTVFQLFRKIDNTFNLSYHLYFPQKWINFNFWFEKISYINSHEKVTVSMFNKNGKSDKLRNIFSTDILKELEEKVSDLFLQYS